jgi:hypothetical protein
VPDLISRGTRNELREYFVGTTLREIEMAFEAADLSPDRDFSPEVGGSRRSFVEQHYHRISWTDGRHVRRILSVFEGVLRTLDTRIESNPNDEPAAATRKRLLGCLERDGYIYAAGRLKSAAGRSHLSEAAAAFAHLDAPELEAQIQRMRDSIESDPGLAIGTSKELVETACKTILEDFGRTINPDWDLVQLSKEARDTLEILPENVPERAKGVVAIKKLLANLGVVVQSLAEVRNLYGTGHGRSVKRQALLPRHGRLAVGAATTLATFLMETHWQKKP